MTLWLTRMPLETNALAHYAAERGLMGQRGHDEGRVLHHLLVETFGKVTVPDPAGQTVEKGAFQPFRVMVGRGKATLYGYTGLSREELQDNARSFALPEAFTILSPDRIEEKAMPAEWLAGRILGFDLRTLPLVRLNSALPPSAGAPKGWKAGTELDAFLAHVLRDAPDGDPQAQQARREGIYLDWLAARLAPAAELLRPRTRLVRFRRIRTERGRAGEAPEAVFHGTLRIADPEGFARLLARGVARHCAYGFGMLLLRPPGQKPPEG